MASICGSPPERLRPGYWRTPQRIPVAFRRFWARKPLSMARTWPVIGYSRLLSAPLDALRDST